MGLSIHFWAKITTFVVIAFLSILPTIRKVLGYGLRPRRSFFPDGLASINARMASRRLCTSSRKASAVGEDGPARRQFNRNSMGADTRRNRQNRRLPPARTK
jgi:hypothetical protein